MAVTFVSQGSGTGRAGVGDLSPPFPVYQEADLIVLMTVAKYELSTVAVTGAGQINFDTRKTTSGRTAGIDNGNVVGDFYYRIASSSAMPAVTVRLGGAGGVNMGATVMNSFRSGTGRWYIRGHASEQTSTPGSPLQVTLPITVRAGDFIVVTTSMNGDLPNFGTVTVTSTGATIGAATLRSNTAYTNGDDARMGLWEAPVTAGTGNGSLTISVALTGTTTNAVGVIGALVVAEDPALNMPPAVSPTTTPTSLPTAAASSVAVSAGATDDEAVLDYQWRLVSAPPGYRGSFDNENVANPTFLPTQGKLILDDFGDRGNGSLLSTSKMFLRHGVGNTPDGTGVTTGMIVDFQNGFVRFHHVRNNDNCNAYGSALTDHFDVDVTARFKGPGQDVHDRGLRIIYIRSAQDFANESIHYPSAGYALFYNVGGSNRELRVDRCFSSGGVSDGVTIASVGFPKGPLNGDVFLRFQMIGSVIKAKAWHEDVDQPRQWNFSVSDSNVLTRGKLDIRSRSFASSAGNTEFDLYFPSVDMEILE